MLEGKNVLVIGARSGGYGESLAQAALKVGANVFGTTLTPDDPKEQSYFKDIGVTLVPVALRFDVDRRDSAMRQFQEIESWLRSQGIERIDAVIHAVAGGFPRQPAVMKSVGDILKGKTTFSDLATSVKRDVYYVNGGSFEDTINGMAGLSHTGTQFLALSYRGKLPYFISQTKRYLEGIGHRMAQKGFRTVVAAFPEAWTQSSQFFKGIELGVLNNYVEHVRGQTCESDEIREAFDEMNGSLDTLEGFSELMERLEPFLMKDWSGINSSSDPADLSSLVDSIFKDLRREGIFPILRQSVEIISEFVRQASSTICIRDFLVAGRYLPGEVRQIQYFDLLGSTHIELAPPRPNRKVETVRSRKWLYFERDDVRKTMFLYGKNFLFLDRVIMEAGEYHEGFMGFARYTVPTPEENPILKDHFVGMPIFGGHLQMEMVGQFGTFIIQRLISSTKMAPILTGSEFPDLNTMAPPGETLKLRGVVRLPDRRNVIVEAVIENRFARSKGIVRGMLVSQRVIQKMLNSFKPQEK